MLFIAAIYLVGTCCYSVVFGLPPARNGFAIGYPVIYYEFPVHGDLGIEKQHGFTGIKNLAINIGVMTALSLIYTILEDKTRSAKSQT